MQGMNKIILTVISILFYSAVNGQIIEGVIVDSKSKKTIVGALVAVKGTSIGAITENGGKFHIANVGSDFTLEISHVSYKSAILENIKLNSSGTTVLNIELETSDLLIDNIIVRGRTAMETITALKNERKNSNVAIQNIGIQEMSIKGISSAEEGVEKITSVSLNNGQLFVRGLGDRYSITTLNGLSIASPNPDNKIIPLDIFPSSTINDITVSKVFQVASFADYSGAHININTRENVEKDFFKVSLNTGTQGNTLSNTFYKSDIKSMLTSNNISKTILDMKPSEFSEYIKTNDIFETDFSIKTTTALPDLSLTLSGGKMWNIGADKFSVLASVRASNSSITKLDSYVTSYNAQGVQLNMFNYDSYTQELKITALTSIGYSFSNNDKINYTLFYARNAINDYKIRDGFDSEGIDLIGSNSVFHSYSLLNNQLSGSHSLTSRLSMIWSSSYGTTKSEEPDRRQVMYRKDEDGKLSLFKLNQQETMRYFGELIEDEIVGDIKFRYLLGSDNSIRIGGTYKEKNRDYSSTRFYYNIQKLDPTINNIFDTDSYLNQENISNGSLTINKDSQPRSSYFAGTNIVAGFVELDYYIISKLLLNIGIRYENSGQWVKYWNDASLEKRAELKTNDFFPAINLKYDMSKQNSLRFSLSKTVTRPSFVEMAPFLYKESYGSAEVRGNNELQNGYNYNADVRLDLFNENSNDIFSITGYYKYLLTPIERIQETSGGSVVHSFRNADNGIAMGVELEFKKSIFSNLEFGINGSYMYTNVILPADGGVYTDTERALQGASPYLLNADITYISKLNKKSSSMSLSLLYNYQGERIETVGIYGMSNIIQEDFHTLNFVVNYRLNRYCSFSLQIDNILNSETIFTQEIDGKPIPIEKYEDGIKFKLGVSFTL